MSETEFIISPIRLRYSDGQTTYSKMLDVWSRLEDRVERRHPEGVGRLEEEVVKHAAHQRRESDPSRRE